MFWLGDGAIGRGIRDVAARTTGERTQDVRPVGRIAIEIAVALAILAAVAAAYFPGGTFSELKPHPFGLVVLVASLQYGTVAGLAATLAALGAHWLTGWPPSMPDESHFGYLARVSTEPATWFGAALLIGELRDRQIDDQATTLAELEASNADRDLLAGHAHALGLKVDTLERELARRPADEARSTLASLLRLQSASAQERGRLLGTCGEAVLGARRISLWRLEALQGGAARLALVAASGWSDGQNCVGLISAGDPLFEVVVTERRGVSGLRHCDLDALDGQGVFAVPLRGPTTGRVIGMLKVEDVNVDRMMDDGLEALSLLGDAVAMRFASWEADGSGAPEPKEIA